MSGLRAGWLAVLAVAGIVVCAAPRADAAVPPFFGSFPSPSGGAAADELNSPAAIAADPGNGHVYVAERGNSRISEFDAWGQFVKTWGWGVVASGPNDDPQNEIQEVVVEPAVTGGTFKLSPRELEQTTTSVAYDASASTVEEALEALASIGSGNVEVSGEAGGPWTIEYVGALADQDITPLQVVESALVGGEAGATTTQGGANFEVCEPDKGDVCRQGQRVGVSPGEIREPGGLAFDPVSGDLYVYEGNKQWLGSRRVQRFDPATGEFLAMIGGEVNKTTSANLCTKADIEGGDECGAGVTGTGDAQFSISFEIGRGGGNVTVDGAGNLYVGDVDRIQKFDSSGNYLKSLPLPENGEARALVYDGFSDSLYFAYRHPIAGSEKKPDIYKLNPETGEVLSQIALKYPWALSTDPEGNLYVVAQNDIEKVPTEVIAYDALGKPLIGLGEGFDRYTGSAALNPRPGVAVNTGCETLGIYVANEAADGVDAFGETPNPELCPPPPVPPTITEQFAVSAGENHAAVKATINAHFWADTSFYVEYGTEDCGLGECTRVPLGHSIDLAGATTNVPVGTSAVVLTGLKPDTVYHYRFVADSSGGGPVSGIGEEELGATFRTRKPIDSTNVECPNQALRTGTSAHLPDCRAYEMVSPIDKDGGNAVGRPGGAAADQSSISGDGFTFSSYRSFGDAQGANFFTQYLAERGATGWSSNAISPPMGATFVAVKNIPGNDFRFFSEDLCTGWFVRNSDPPLTEDAPESYANLYRQSNCPVGSPDYVPTVDVPVQESLPFTFWPELQGLSEDGETTVFRANGKLTSDAASGPELRQVYARVDGELELVSVLPDGKPSSTNSTVGSAADNSDSEGVEDMVARAVSADGSRIYWTQGGKKGKVYVRVNGSNTRKVSELVSEKDAQFWTASTDGSIAYFTVKSVFENGTLYRYDFDAATATPIASEVPGVIGTSVDGSLVYFVSEEALAPGAVAEAPNLYLDQEGELTLVTPLDPADSSPIRASMTSTSPAERLSRITDDGSHLVFVSTSGELSEETAGYDNTDAVSGEPDAQVYLYDAESDRLSCISCDPTGVRPSGRVIDNGTVDVPKLWAAASIPGWTNQFYPGRVLAQDGSSLYFNSYTPLVAADTNGKADVYQWQELGTGECEEGSSAFVEATGGCVRLISTGKSAVDAEFLDTSEGGEDVFFLTEEGLVNKDREAIDVYDARVGGGFAEPPPPPSECAGEACQSPSVSPATAAPLTQSIQGSGNVKPKKAKRCPTGKHKIKRKGKVRCVKNKKKKRRAKHRIGAHRRAR